MVVWVFIEKICYTPTQVTFLTQEEMWKPWFFYIYYWFYYIPLLNMHSLLKPLIYRVLDFATNSMNLAYTIP